MAQLCYKCPKRYVAMVEITSLDSGSRLYSFASQLRCLPTTGAWGTFPNIAMFLSFCNAKSKNNAYPQRAITWFASTSKDLELCIGHGK